jgi:hypothetical protein
MLRKAVLPHPPKRIQEFEGFLKVVARRLLHPVVEVDRERRKCPLRNLVREL